MSIWFNLPQKIGLGRPLLLVSMISALFRHSPPPLNSLGVCNGLQQHRRRKVWWAFWKIRIIFTMEIFMSPFYLHKVMFITFLVVITCIFAKVYESSLLRRLIKQGILLPNVPNHRHHHHQKWFITLTNVNLPCMNHHKNDQVLK